MKKLKVSAIVLTFVVFLVSSITLYAINKVPSELVHFHANFLIVQDGKVIDFSSPAYMHIEPCGEDVFDPTETLDLHDDNGETVHVHAPHVTWSDLLVYLKLPIKEPDIAMVNGQRLSGLLTRKIYSADRMLAVYGQKVSDIELETWYSKIATDAATYNSGLKGVENCSGAEEDNQLSIIERIRIAFRI
ncbi:MAG TPA: hypothetical protein VJ246_04020 [Patescibacteria group bacterium]|nr:hypothetical protein [Patescibacteria group bacterium]